MLAKQSAVLDIRVAETSAITIQTFARRRLQPSAVLAQQYATKCAGYAESRFATVQVPPQA